MEKLITDNGPQFSSAEFAKFTNSWGFTHITSSPRYPQSNGESERAVQTAKSILSKNSDPYLALLMYRATPLRNGYSPAELACNRKFCTIIPAMPRPNVLPDNTIIQEKENRIRQQSKLNFDLRHRAHCNSTLQPGDSVIIRDKSAVGKVVQNHQTPRSYIVSTPSGMLRRNRSALSKVGEKVELFALVSWRVLPRSGTIG